MSPSNCNHFGDGFSSSVLLLPFCWGIKVMLMDLQLWCPRQLAGSPSGQGRVIVPLPEPPGRGALLGGQFGGEQQIESARPNTPQGSTRRPTMRKRTTRTTTKPLKNCAWALRGRGPLPWPRPHLPKKRVTLLCCGLHRVLVAKTTTRKTPQPLLT